MGAFLFYLIKSGICLVLLYLSFRFLMSRTTFFRLNRLILVIGMMCCALLPLVELTTEKQLLYNPLQSIRSLLDDALFYQPFAGDVLIADGDGFRLPEDIDQWSEPNGEIDSVKAGIQLLPLVLVGIYLLGGLLVFLWIVISTFRMLTFVRRAEQINLGKYKLIVSAKPVSSFSWGRYIVISEADYSQYADEILKHEMMHLRNHHTLDLLFLQLFLIFHWFNPVVWLLKRELQEIHEYEADNGVIHTGIDATRYQLLLVKKAVGTRLYSMANGFNHSKLKNRITMMLKERTNRWAQLKLMLFVPVVAGTLYAFAQPEVKEVLQQVKPEVQQEKTDDYSSLMDFFRKEGEAYSYRNGMKASIRLNGKHQNDSVRQCIIPKAPAHMSEKRVHQLFVNAKNKLMFDHEFVEQVDELQPIVMRNLLKSWKESGKKDAQIVALTCDRGSDTNAVVAILKEVKSAFEQIRADLSAGSTDKSKEYLDQLFPILLLETAPKEFGGKALSQEQKISEIAVTLQTPEGLETVENFTLSELEKKVVAARAKMPHPEDFVVSLKVNKDCKVGIVTDVKQVLRKAYALTINYDSRQEK